MVRFGALMNEHRRILLLIASVLALAACGASNNCDPATIVVGSRCFWEKSQACDAIGCLPPNECVVHEGRPASVECQKP